MPEPSTTPASIAIARQPRVQVSGFKMLPVAIPPARSRCYSGATMTDAIEKLLAQAAQSRREKRPADAHRDLLQAVALALACQARDSATLARAVTELGRIERDLGHTDAALALYQEAAAIYRERADALKLAHTVRHVGDIYQDAGRAPAAEPCFHEALAIYRAHPETPPLELANAVRPLALLKDDAGAFDEADRLWEEAKDLYASVNVLPGVAQCAARLALLARRREDTERARRMLAEASAAAESSGDYNSVRYVNEVRSWIAG
jgi:tetratricopeptide (TPR) repeat protein